MYENKTKRSQLVAFIV